MRLSEMLTAIREYPALKIQYEAMREQQASQERTAVQLSIAYNNLRIGNRQLSRKNKALETALAKLVPRLNSREHCRRFYKTVAPYLDPGGFVLYRSAAELTRFHISTEFATEDNMGKFEEMDGYGMLRYLTADRFGSVEYEIGARAMKKLFRFIPITHLQSIWRLRKSCMKRRCVSWALGNCSQRNVHRRRI